jgi:hypothetical protein
MSEESLKNLADMFNHGLGEDEDVIEIQKHTGERSCTAHH